MNKQEVILHLSLIKGVGPLAGWRVLQLLQRDEDFFNLYNLSSLEIGFKFGLPPKVALALYGGLKDKSLFLQELSLIQQHGIKWLTLIDEDYPQLLKNSYSPPLVLYYKGSNIFNEKSISIVGSRKINDYGIKAINKIVEPLVKNGWIIVSGGAIGADSKAHEETVKCGGKTVVILGSGLLKPYPYSNIKLFEQIIKNGGAVVSSFALLEEPFAGNFPARNRIISGISLGCVVVQAALKSGTRITANFALEQGREVFAIPGPIDDELSAGCHALIKEGAKLVHSADDILIEFNEQKATAEVTNNTGAQEWPTPGVSNGNIPLEDKLVDWCSSAISVEELLILSELGLPQLQTLLFNLELDGKIVQNFAGMWLKR